MTLEQFINDTVEKFPKCYNLFWVRYITKNGQVRNRIIADYEEEVLTKGRFFEKYANKNVSRSWIDRSKVRGQIILDHRIVLEEE